MSPRQVCVCGCGKRAVHLHHAVYQQELRAVAKQGRGAWKLRYNNIVQDGRNLVPVSFDCHGAHHNRSRPLPLHVLPDAVFEFAAETLNPGPAWAYLNRRYAGDDPRLDRMIGDA